MRERAQVIVNFEETLSGAHGKFEKRNNVLQPSIIVINSCIIIIINVHYHYLYNTRVVLLLYYISNKALLEECDA